MALHSSKSVKILFLIKESTILEERGLNLRKLVCEFLGQFNNEFEKILSAVSVLITHS